ncbi:brassinosteroid-responsive RING protein 1-like [Miscanthus floridulus]|uniref:brassinosteroid-responsive RING protein 1-like n=1 Tax=Miscanthus floridulus TaxID=154761 RepID=UPI00345744BE
MGFPLVCYCLPIPKPVIAFCKLLSAITDAVLLMLAVVGLCRFPHDAAARASAEAHRHQPEEVKSRLPAVEYAQLLAEQQQPSSSSGAHAACQQCRDHGGGEDDAPACIVCLETLEATDEVRRLGNCAHAFHRTCIDRWIDLGRATCPLCRSDLLPRPRGRAGLLGLGRLATRLTRVW